MDLFDFLNTLIDGVGKGGIYAFLALAYSLVFTTSGVFNLAQAQLMVLGALLGNTVLVRLGMPWPVALLVVGVVVALVAVVQYATSVAPASRGHGWILTTLGAAFLLQSFYAVIWGTAVLPVPAAVNSSTAYIAGVRWVPSQALMVAAVLLVAAALELLARSTRLGKAWRAVSQDRDTAGLLGINPTAITIGAFALAAAVGAIGGLMAAPVTYADPYGGEAYSFKGFLAVAIGGMTNTTGAVVGGLLFGIIEAFSIRIVGANFYSVAVFAVALVFLMVRPTGLFARAQLREV